LEYSIFPTPAQQAFGRGLIDLGADMVVGHHPHIIQGVENYKGKFIFYSLGNFNLGDNWDMRPRFGKIGMVLIVEFEGPRLVGYEIVPVELNDCFQPSSLPEERAEKVRKIVSEISEPFSKGITWLYWIKRCGWTTFRAHCQAWKMGLWLRPGRKDQWTTRLRMLGHFARPCNLVWGCCSLMARVFAPSGSFSLPDDV
jgi:hypothetical protein